MKDSDLPGSLSTCGFREPEGGHKEIRMIRSMIFQKLEHTESSRLRSEGSLRNTSSQILLLFSNRRLPMMHGVRRAKIKEQLEDERDKE